MIVSILGCGLIQDFKVASGGDRVVRPLGAVCSKRHRALARRFRSRPAWISGSRHNLRCTGLGCSPDNPGIQALAICLERPETAPYCLRRLCSQSHDLRSAGYSTQRHHQEEIPNRCRAEKSYQSNQPQSEHGGLRFVFARWILHYNGAGQNIPVYDD